MRFLDIANASARELEYQVTLATRLGCLSPPTGDETIRLAGETNRVLAALLKSLRNDSI